MSFRHAFIALFALFAAACTAQGTLQPKSTESVFVGPDAMELAEQVAVEWLETTGAVAVADIDTLEPKRAVIDDLGMAHLRFDQFEAGVPVFGGQVVVHMHANGQVDKITDGLVRGLRTETVPTLSADRGIDSALENHSGPADSVDADLQILRHEGADYVTWRVQIDATDSDAPSMPVIFVDARSGEPVWRYDNLQTVLDRRTYDGRNRNGLPGRLERSEGDGPIGDAPIDDAHDYAGVTWNYYMAQEGRDSFDGAGARLTSTAHHKRNYDNAFWNGTQMVYGDGDVYFYPLSGSLDVVGHELTHAVTEYSANLVYANESGGLNEATSDIIGVAIDAYSKGWLVDANTWKVGEDIAKPALGDALRYMDDPTLDGSSIDHYSDYYTGIDVHHSSGIANKAFYLMATGGAFDLESAAHVWYRALTLYMTPSTTFAQARTATVDAASDLHGAASAQVAAVEGAWTAVGVGPALAYTVIDTQNNLSASTSQQLTFSYATAPGSQGISFAIAGGSGDADLYVRFGSAPTTTTYDCRPYANGNTESCLFEPNQVGTYHVMINAYAAYSGLNLTVSEAGGTPPLPDEICDDGLDNDEDGAFDCDDSDCAFDLACAEPEVCTDGIDNDLDGDVDCDDADCAADVTCPQPEVCDDGIDNDLDGDLDCDDADCAADAVCPQPEVCDDGVDNDLDGATDCADSDCTFDAACVDPEVCDDGIDNDLDGAFDCADSDCALDLACATPEDCGDGIDNDLDGDTDCADLDCELAPECATSCPGGEFTGVLSGTNKDDYYTDAAAASGLFEADLSGDSGTNFDLHLQYFNGSRWRDRQKSNNGDSTESVSYNENSVVLHRWRVRRRAGTGAYNLCVQ